MAISLDVVTKLNDRSARTAAQDAQKYFDQASRTAGSNFDRNLSAGFDKASRSADRSATNMQKAFDRAADAAGRVRVEQEKYNQLIAKGSVEQTKLVQQTERLASVKRAEATAVKQAASAHHDYSTSLRNISTELGNATNSSNGFMGSITMLGQGIMSLSRVGGPVMIATLGAGLVQLAGAAAVAAQSLWVLPGAIGAIGAAFGTIKLATSGMEDAFSSMGDPEKFAEALNKLAPSAQQFMLNIRAMMPELREFQKATQGAFFEGIGPQLTQLSNTFLPMIQQMTTGVASAFNSMFSGVSSQLMTSQTQASIQEFLGNVTSAFQQLAPAAAPLTAALADIMAVGSGVLPDLASAAADAARSFAQFISEARQSGDLQRWLEQGMAALGAIKDIAWDVGRAFMALAPVGAEILPQIVGAFDTLANIMPVLTEAGGAFLEIVRLISGDMSALPDLFNRIGDWGVTAFNSVRDALDKMFDPVRAGIDLFNKIPGVADIPQIPSFAGGGMSGGGGSFGPAAPTTAGGGAAGDLGPGMYRRRDGSFGYVAPPSVRSADGGSIAPSWGSDYSAYGSPSSGGSGASAKTPEGLVPNADLLKTTLERLFPGVSVNADVGRQDSFGEHASGEALDIMVGSNRELGDKINRFLLMNSDALGLQYNLWRRAQWDPSGQITPMEDRGSPTQNHMDHVHARVSAGQRASGNIMPIGAAPYQSGIQGVSVEKFGSSAQGDLSNVGGQIGNQIDQDFGLSKGLPGLAENAVKFVGNLFFAPLLTALQAMAGMSPDQGSGLFGMMNPGSGGGFGGLSTGPSMAGFSAAAAPSASAMGPAALQPPWSADWNAIAQKESSGDWGINTGNGYSGGLQFSPSSWEAAGGTKYAPSAHLATPFQQAMTAEELLKMQGPGAWPNTFVPGSAGPGGGAPSLAGMPPMGGGSTMPGAGMPQGMAYPAQSGGGGLSMGGMAMDAAMMGTTALDAMMPGAGAAAKMGIQLANRTVKYASEAAGIGVSGALETLSIGDNPMGSLGNSWFGKFAGGIAGARPAGGNVAGQKAAAPTPEGKDPRSAALAGMQAGKAGKSGDTNITVNNSRQTEDGTGRDIAWHLYDQPGRQ